MSSKTVVVFAFAVLAATVSCEQLSDDCTARITESIPQGMTFTTNLTTSDSWLHLLNTAKTSVEIASFYWSLADGASNSSLGGDVGLEVYNAIIAAANRGVNIRVVQSQPSAVSPDDDTAALVKGGYIELRTLNMTKVFGGGVLHTKFFVVDGDRFWVGSANMDWRSLEQVKELGVEVSDCPTMTQDLAKIWEEYWIAAGIEAVPKAWPKGLETVYNMQEPAQLKWNGEPAKAFVASSPKPFCPLGRTYDLDAITLGIFEAKRTVSIEVMDYIPAIQFGPPAYWGAIDDAIRQAALAHNVHVRLLIGNWTYSAPYMFPMLRSLEAFGKTCDAGYGPYGAPCTGGVEVRLFNVPVDPKGTVPYTRVNHAKFMVTDEVAFIGTSNWSADYFIDTGGVSLNIHQKTFIDELQSVFDRDWTSSHSVPLPMN